MSDNRSDIPDLAADLGEVPTSDELGLPPLEALLDAFPAPDADTFESMIDVAVDPATEDPGADLIPDDEPGAGYTDPVPEDDDPWNSDLGVTDDPATDPADLPDPSDDDPLAGWE